LRNLLNESKNFSKNEEIEMEIERRESTGENNNTKKLDPLPQLPSLPSPIHLIFILITTKRRRSQ